jgi:hypothetical protein
MTLKSLHSLMAYLSKVGCGMPIALSWSLWFDAPAVRLWLSEWELLNCDLNCDSVVARWDL